MAGDFGYDPKITLSESVVFPATPISNKVPDGLSTPIFAFWQASG